MKKVYILDAVKIIFQADPAAAGLFFIMRLLQALTPILQTLAVAAFVDRVSEAAGILGTDTAAGRMRTGGMRAAGIPDTGILLLILLLVALAAFGWISKSAAALLGQHMEMRLRAGFKPRLMEKISRLKYEAMENGALRDQISRVSRNAEGRVREAYESLLQLLELIVKTMGILAILFTQVWWLSFLLLAVSIPCFRLSVKSGKADYDAQADMTKISRQNEAYHEMLTGRAYADERTLFGYHRAYRERYLEQYEKARRYATGIRLKWFVKMKAGSMAVILISAVSLAAMLPLTLNGALSAGMFMALMNAIFGIVQNMSWDLTYGMDRAAWYQNWFRELSEVFALPEDPGLSAAGEETTAEREPASFRTLEFQNVSFRYPGTDRDILKNCSFRIQAGKKYAFVGANGAGKTTIVKLLNGLYQDYEGQILVNGRDIRQTGRDFLSNVFQDFARYPVSLRENITIGRKGPVSEEELWQAVEAAGLAGTAKQLKDGLDTVLGKAEEGSLDLSGGQWQRIALARCILSPAAVRILDEPTSSLDPIRESEIYTGFRQMSRGKTVLLISHRLASVKLSDHIFVIAGGRVAEEGSHAQLMRKDGLYRKMYEEQAKWYEEGKNSVWKWKGGEEACEP